MNNICEFLLHLFDEGVSSSSLNTARSALSFFLSYDFPLKDDPTVGRLFQYFYKERPKRAKYFVYWPVEQLLVHLSAKHPPSSLSLKELTLKTLALIALTSSDRGQSIHLMDVEKTTCADEEVCFIIDSRLKHTRRILKPKVIKCLPCDNPALNVGQYVVAYMNRTIPLRAKRVADGFPKPTQLFLSWATKKPVSRQTLSRWLKSSLKEAGIDTDQFSAHSFRGSGLSHAFTHGASIKDIVVAGSWTNTETFRLHYFAPNTRSEVGKIILNSISKQ